MCTVGTCLAASSNRQPSLWASRRRQLRVAAAAHARLAQSYAVDTLYLPSRHVPHPSDRANLPQSPAMARRLRKAVTTETEPPHLKARPQNALAFHERRWRVRESKEWA